MSIIKFIKDSTIASSVVFLGATVGTVGIVSGTALAHGKSAPVVVLVHSPVKVNVVSVSNYTVQEASSGDVLNGGGFLSSTSNKGDVYSGNVSNTNTTTVSTNQTN